MFVQTHTLVANLAFRARLGLYRYCGTAIIKKRHFKFAVNYDSNTPTQFFFAR